MGAYVMVSVVTVLISVTVELVYGELEIATTEHSYYHNLLLPGFFRYPFIDQPE